MSSWTRTGPVVVEPDAGEPRRLSGGPLVRESGKVGLVVVGSHGGPSPIDPVTRGSLAAMTCPVAIVPHHLSTPKVPSGAGPLPLAYAGPGTTSC